MSSWKYAARIAYRGGAYSGWQRQKEGLGVQEVLEEALSRLASGPVRVIGAGRTDKGVHAVGQVASFRMDRDWAPDRLQLAANFHLPEDVRVMGVYPVSERFDARRSALWREYRYFIWHGWVCPPHLNGLVWWRKVPWAIDRARAACRLLEGEHDFRAFCKTGECPERSVRRLDRVRLQRWGPMTVLTVRAHQANSHRGRGWETFTDKIIALLNAREKPLAFVLWGAQARKKKDMIDIDRHFIVESSHPSPYSAPYGFFGSRPFSKVNAFLESVGETPVDWQIPDM